MSLDVQCLCKASPKFELLVVVSFRHCSIYPILKPLHWSGHSLLVYGALTSNSILSSGHHSTGDKLVGTAAQGCSLFLRVLIRLVTPEGFLGHNFGENASTSIVARKQKHSPWGIWKGTPANWHSSAEPSSQEVTRCISVHLQSRLEAKGFHSVWCPACKRGDPLLITLPSHWVCGARVKKGPLLFHFASIGWKS